VKTLVDTNVLLDVITRDPKWATWSEDALREAAERSTLAINPIVFAEVSMKFHRIEDTDAALVDFARGQGLPCVQTPRRREALAHAGFLRRCARRHRSNESAHARCPAVPHVLPHARNHRALRRHLREAVRVSQW
jgi:predicted nucleic acid-binding protein